jgi:rhomboid protease GluP
VKGLGQGYVLTPEGRIAAKNPAELERLKKSARTATLNANGEDSADVSVVSVPLANDTSEDANSKTESETADEMSSDSDLAFRPPLVVPALLMTNSLWFFVCAVWSVRWGLTPFRLLWALHKDVLPQSGSVSGTNLLNGEWWRLLTSCFVHIGVLHLIGNLFALAMMGPLAELLWGRTRLLLIYLISGLVGSALAMTLRPDSVLAGASGAIWGVQMSLFAWLFAFRRQLPPDLASDWFRRLGVVFVLNAGISFLPEVSWEAHLGGGAAGFLVATLLNVARFGDQQRRISAWVLIAFLPILSVAGLALAMDANGMPGWQHLRQRLAAEQEAREKAERKQKWDDAQAEFNTHAEPRLTQLAPDAVKQSEAEALIILPMRKRPEGRLKTLRAKIEALKTTADEAVSFTTRDPTGNAYIDTHRDRAKAFAVARSRSFALLLEMLASAEPPKAETWDAWKAARHEADRLWGELTAKRE